MASMGGRKGKTRPRRPTSLEQARRTVAALEELLRFHLTGLNLPTDPDALIDALQALDDDSPLAPLKDDAYYAVVYLEIARDEIDPLRSDPDPSATVSHIAMAQAFINAVPGSRKLVDRRRKRSAASTLGARARTERYAKRRLAVTPTIDKIILADPERSDSAIDANITTTSRYVRSTPVRLAQALERMEAAAETLVDADDQPHLAAVR